MTEVLKEAAQKEATLTTKMVHMIDNKTMREIEKEMSAIIGHERVVLIKKSFAIETYRMKVVKKSDGKSAVQVHRKGIEFQPERMLMTINDIETATVLQWASLVAELFLFLLSCAGIGVDLSEAEMRTVVQEVDVLVQEPAFQRAVENFVEAWNEAGGGAWGKAKAIFSFLKDSYSLGFFWKIIKLIVQNMTTWEKIRAIGEVAVMIVAAFATEGLALIARIALAVDSAVYLAEKITNLIKFSDMKKTMK
jgi:predicted small integral membrane protein